ncbi:MAG: putative sugar kinase [Actinomycetia bacterium]|nr:putative sugar kinase [Actinomycetes bacterium]
MSDGSATDGPVHPGPVLAVDVGGTKLAAGIVDDQGALSVAARIDTPLGTDAERLFAALLGLIHTVVGEDEAGMPARCGVGCGGPMEHHGELVSPLNIPAWRRFPLRARLAAELGVPVAVDNDAKALALGEGWRGAAQGTSNYLAMVVSTGVGGGIVLDGRLLEGASGNAGHIGHIVVEPDGRVCECGGRGCLEAEASGTAIAAITGRPAVEADAATIQRVGTLVGRGVADVVTLLDLPLAVVAGSVALGYGTPFFAAANAELAARARLDFARGARIVPAGLGGSAPLIGAAAVARSRA